jgi:hypothetical protein
MKIIIVPGNSPHNERWAESLKEFLRTEKDYKDIFILKYLHWSSGKEIMDVKKEALRLKDILPKNEKYLIIAKSAGILVSMKTTAKPVFFLFLGLPLKWIDGNGFNSDKLFSNLSTPSLIIQNKKDPMAFKEDVSSYIEKNKLNQYIKLLESPGDTHEYNDFEIIFSVIKKIA